MSKKNTTTSTNMNNSGKSILNEGKLPNFKFTPPPPPKKK